MLNGMIKPPLLLKDKPFTIMVTSVGVLPFQRTYGSEHQVWASTLICTSTVLVYEVVVCVFAYVALTAARTVL